MRSLPLIYLPKSVRGHLKRGTNIIFKQPCFDFREKYRVIYEPTFRSLKNRFFWILITASFACFDWLQRTWNCQSKERTFLNTICTAIIKKSHKSNICISASASYYSEKSFSQLRNVGC